MINKNIGLKETRKKRESERSIKEIYLNNLSYFYVNFTNKLENVFAYQDQVADI